MNKIFNDYYNEYLELVQDLVSFQQLNQETVVTYRENDESLYSKYKDDGLVVIGVPSNQFLYEEPGDSKEILEFCEYTFGITFPLTEKSKVKVDIISSIIFLALLQ